MQRTKVDLRHYNAHVEEHQSFLEDVKSMHNEMSSKSGKLSKELLDFLTHWLAYHILGSDKNLGKQIEKIKFGTDPAEAYDMVEKKHDSSTEPLLLAINGLFQIVSSRNKELKKMKVPTGDGYWYGSVSIGIAVKNKNMEDFNTLIKAADDGVYAAKRAGKNCVRTSTS